MMEESNNDRHRGPSNRKNVEISSVKPQIITLIIHFFKWRTENLLKRFSAKPIRLGWSIHCYIVGADAGMAKWTSSPSEF
jgi:hypothetical protein